MTPSLEAASRQPARTDGPFPGDRFRKLYEPLVVRIIRREMRLSLEKLKQLLEAE